jgi:hypothetical protein
MNARVGETGRGREENGGEEERRGCMGKEGGRPPIF